ncbi:MAG: hypothetical protein JJU13_12545 [Balneolaceae bacterium]|nr:hypothetical protein [Balneolaceae bacterium]
MENTRENSCQLIILLFSLSLILSSCASKENATSNKGNDIIIDYDFTEGKFNNMVKYIEYRDMVSLRVTNLNRQAVDTQIGISLIDYESEMPEALINLTTTELGEETKIDTLIVDERTEKFRSSYSQFRGTYIELFKINTLFHQIESTSNDPFITKDIFLERVKDHCKQITLNKNVCDFDDEKLRNIIVAEVIEVDERFNSHYLNLIHEIRDLEQEEKYREDVRIIEESLKPIFENYQKLEIISNAQKIHTLIDKMKRHQNYIQTSAPVQATSNIVRFDYTVKHTEEDDQIITFELPVKGKDQLTFSTGFSINNLWWRKFEEFNVRSVTDSTSTIGRDQFRSYGPKLSVFAHYFRTCNFLNSLDRFNCDRFPNLGLFGGISLEGTDLADTNYLAGLSVIIGRNYQFNINAGVSFKKVNVLRSQFEIGEIYSDDQLNDSITRNTYKPGLMFGISYTIINRSERD